MWNDTKRIRRTPLLKIMSKLKTFPILTSPGSGKDFMYLKQISKFPFVAIKSPWEGPIINFIIQ